MFTNLFKPKTLSKDDIANILSVNPNAYKAFEEEYKTAALEENNFLKTNSEEEHFTEEQLDIIKRIELELLSQARVFEYKDCKCNEKTYGMSRDNKYVTLEEIKAAFPKNAPQLSATLQKRDVGLESAPMLMEHLCIFTDEQKPVKKRQIAYNLFRQGLDILDIDALTYEMIDCNINSMGHWLPKIILPVREQGFFKIPETRILKVPINILQLTRLEYGTLTLATFKIVNDFLKEVFDLDANKEYFIKTGTYSNKFDFRNARITGPEEVKSMGEYFIYNHGDACRKAGPLCTPSIYGMSTTTEWVVREFIKDVENNPCIYKGLPLHTEYRVFVDFDRREVLSVVPYWEPETMKIRFGEGADHSIHDLHDYAIYKKHEPILMERYNNNFSKVKSNIEKIIPDIDLPGQWSIDIMQNGDDFWIIDMALAQTSMFKESIPVDERRIQKENWLPDLKKYERRNES